MDLTPTADQRMLKDGVDDFARNYLPRRAESLAHPHGCRPDVWRQIAELGWLGVDLPEEAGGFAMGPVAESLVHEAVGACLMTEPVLAATAGARLLALTPPAARRDDALARAVGGEERIVLAHDEPQLRGARGPIAMSATPTNSGYRLVGRKGLVRGAPGADSIVLSAIGRTGETVLLLVNATLLVGHMRIARTIDGGAASEIELDGLDVDASCLLAEGIVADQALAIALDRAVMAACAEAVGAIDATIATTRDHLNVRQQFGQTIGGFQALQHKLADMVIAAELARSILLYALAGVTSEGACDGGRIAAAMVRVGDSARLVAAHAVQLHGGIGVTEEHIVSHYFRKLTAFAGAFGGRDHHLARFADSSAAKETVLWE